MPTFILAGFQRTLARGIKKALDGGASQFAGWTAVPFVGHQNDAHDIGLHQVDELLMLAGDNDGAHIFGVSTLKSRDLVKAQLSPFFRFRWLDAKPLSLVGSGNETTLLEMLRHVVDEERFWRDYVRPNNSASPLTLPDIFACQRDLKEMWRLSQSYNNLGHLETATKMIHQFSSRHRQRLDGFQNRPWQADDNWIWDDHGERHGRAPFPKDWKYSLRLPDGFHFDVSTQLKGKSHFVDRHGNRHPYKKHINVTAHGEVRGA